MSGLSEIRNIIFDLGGVLLDLDFIAPVIAFKKLGGVNDYFDYRQAIHDPGFLNFETGMITPDEFRHMIREILNNFSVTDDEIDAAWCSMILTVPEEKVNLLKKLGSFYRLFLFSNTNAIHTNYFKQQFKTRHGVSIESLFEMTFYSHLLHDRKPMASGFEKVIRATGILPEETLFVDDFAQNIEAAGKLGFQVYHYTPGTDLFEVFSLT